MRSSPSAALRALDTGKLVNLLAAQEGPAEVIVRGRTPAARAGLPLIALPTTAGSGSEATHFGVVYADKIKYSVASPFMLPDVSVVDPDLTMSVSPRQTAISGMDAFAQAVESYWCSSFDGGLAGRMPGAPSSSRSRTCPAR